MRGSLFVLLPLVALAACSSSDSPSDSPLDGGGNETPESGVGGTAPIADAAVADAADSADAAPKMGCSTVTAKLCEDFDTSTVGKTPTGWTVLNGYGASPPQAVVASDDFHSPPYSLKSSSMVAGAARVQKSLASIGATAGTHWGRLFWKVKPPAPAPPGNGQGPHAPFVALQGNLRAGELRVVDMQRGDQTKEMGKIQLLANTPDDQCCTGTGFTYTIWDGDWHCSEWYVDHVTQSYRFFLDSKEVTSLAFNAQSASAQMPTAFTTVAIGPQFFSDLQTPLTAWLDDLAIDDKQIGCN